jgi:hypothetical protein
MLNGDWIAQGRCAQSRGWCGSCRGASIGVLDHFVATVFLCTTGLAPAVVSLRSRLMGGCVAL